MSKIKTYISKIVENDNEEDMNKLSDMLEEALCDIKEYDEELYKKYKNELFGMAYNYEIDEDLAKEIVEKMKPLGEFWDFETTSNVKNQYGLNDIYKSDFYVVMNSLANDYSDAISTDNVELYVKLAKAFIEDEDACEHKVWKYFTTISM